MSFIKLRLPAGRGASRASVFSDAFSVLNGNVNSAHVGNPADQEDCDNAHDN